MRHHARPSLSSYAAVSTVLKGVAPHERRDYTFCPEILDERRVLCGLCCLAVGRGEVDLGREVAVDPIVVSVLGGCLRSVLFGSVPMGELSIGDIR